MDKRSAVFFAPGMPRECDKCGSRCKYKAQGIYECVECGNQMLDDYGKVRVYLEEHGRQPAVAISAGTGIPVATIQNYLRNGQLEIPDGSPVYAKCEKCGTDIRFGIYCASCASQFSKDIRGTLHMGNIGEKPKNKGTGKMRYFGIDEK